MGEESVDVWVVFFVGVEDGGVVGEFVDVCGSDCLVYFRFLC